MVNIQKKKYIRPIDYILTSEPIIEDEKKISKKCTWEKFICCHNKRKEN